MKLPVHRWYRYSAGFSAEWVRSVISEHQNGEPINVFDPFVGSGTVVLESKAEGVNGLGIESHPFVRRVALAKLNWPADRSDLEEAAKLLLASARRRKPAISNYPDLIKKCFPTETLERLDVMRAAWSAQDDKSDAAALSWLALVSILRSTSPVGTAPWQYVLPRKSKAKPLEPFKAFQNQIDMMRSDMSAWDRRSKGGTGGILNDDAREMANAPEDWADLVITSPPYANNYDYADATRLEQSFLGEVTSWGDLKTTMRPHLVRACTQHVAPDIKKTWDVLGSDNLVAIQPEISEVCSRLEAERETRGGKKPYHTMIAYYFHDLSNVWLNLRRVCRAGGKVCFVIGDSAPYGIHVPVERWLGELALAAGFKHYSFEKLRDRNTKWKNRKHRVKLHEGRLWVEG
jgi:hypothetical protein